jgi:hypothetical protein
MVDPRQLGIKSNDIEAVLSQMNKARGSEIGHIVVDR